MCGGKLVAEVAWHLEYSAEFAWARGKACCWRESAINDVAAAYDLKTNWSVGRMLHKDHRRTFG